VDKKDWKKCPECGGFIPKSWKRHEKCGYVQVGENEDTKIIVGVKPSNDSTIIDMKRSLDDTIKLFKDNPKYMELFAPTQVALSLFIERNRK
jgi:hypothetical protein